MRQRNVLIATTKEMDLERKIKRTLIELLLYFLFLANYCYRE
jgi:hypothetical protein